MATSVQPKDKTVNINGINLHYLDWGAEGKPKVLLLHGLRGHCHSWDDVSAEFCQDYHVLALDQRGRGDSDWAPGGDYSSQSFVADLEGFCQAVGLDSFILVGHSMGGRNAMAFAGRNAEKLQKLVIVDIGPDLAPKGSARITLDAHIHHRRAFRGDHHSALDDYVEHLDLLGITCGVSGLPMWCGFWRSLIIGKLFLG